MALAEGIRGDFWACLADDLLGVDGSNVSLARSFLSSSAVGCGRGGYSAMYNNWRMCDLGDKRGVQGGMDPDAVVRILTRKV